MVKDLVYSFNEEAYYDMDDIIEMVEIDKIPKDRFVYVAEKVKYYHKDFIPQLDIQEQLLDIAYDEVSEWCEGYVDDLTKEKVEALNQVIIDWFDKNIEQPRFFTVKNIRKIMLVEVLKGYNLSEKGVKSYAILKV
jgi:hypothetical protein